eukprot:326931-Prymnesium_polylepis.1
MSYSPPTRANATLWPETVRARTRRRPDRTRSAEAERVRLLVSTVVCGGVGHGTTARRLDQIRLSPLCKAVEWPRADR